MSPHGEPVDLQWLLEATRTGINAEYQEKITRLRRMYAERDEDGSKELKDTLDYITTCGVFTRRNNRGLVEHSGYITLDFDKIREKGQSPEEVKEEVSRHPAVAMAFTSPRGDGVKVVVVLKDRPKTNKENHQAYNAACEALGLAVPADPVPKAVSAPCFLSFDPDCYYAAPETVGPFDWRAYADSHAKKSGRKKGKRAGSQSAGTAGKGDGIRPTPAEWRERCPTSTRPAPNWRGHVLPAAEPRGSTSTLRHPTSGSAGNAPRTTAWHRCMPLSPSGRPSWEETPGDRQTVPGG